MSHLILPIDIEGTKYCCQASTKRTEAILNSSVFVDGEIPDPFIPVSLELDPNNFQIYRAQQGEDVSGSVKFGICCASLIVITLDGEIETLNDEFDNIRVLHNGDEVFYFESTERESSESNPPDPDETIPVGPFVVSIPLVDRACGHIIEISGETVDGFANNDVFWQASIVIT